MNGGPDKAQLLVAIEQAFKDVRLEDGTSLNMTEYNDSGGSCRRYLERAKFDERDDWSRIDDATLEQFKVTFCFTDLKGFRFYMPAYMSYAVRNHEVSDSIIIDFTIYAIDPDHYLFAETPFEEWFTRAQLEAMKMFLEYAVAQEETMDSDHARENLAKLMDHLKTR